MAGFFFNEDMQTPEAIDRRRALINALSKDNLSTAPVQHWTQALARVLGAGADGYETAKLNEADKAGTGKWIKALSDLPEFGGGVSPTAMPSAGAALPASQPAPATPPVPRETFAPTAEDGTPVPPIRPPRLGGGNIPVWAGGFGNTQLNGSSQPGVPAGPPSMVANGGQAQPIAQALLRRFEGFRATPYWDVNAHRVGYGSDTITNPDGSVQRVQPGAQVSQQQAELDLQRRVGSEFMPRAQAAVGEAWNKIPPNAQAALASVTYNYGKLPDSVAAAARSGDTNQIAVAVEGLAGHNGGINADRRRQEAEIIRGGAVPQAANNQQGIPVAPGQAGQRPGVNPALLAALSSPWAQRSPMLAQLAMNVAQQQIGGNKLQYQTDGEGNIIALDPSGRRAPTVVYRAAVKPVMLGEGQQLVNPTTGQPIGNAQQTPKISREIEQRKAEAVKMGLDPNDGRTKQFILTGSYPKDPELTSTDKNAILEADEMVSSNKGTIGALQKAKELSKQAMGFPGAGVVARVGSLGGNKSSEATLEMNQVVVEQALAGLKSTFGGNPTEGERKILLDIQGSASLPDQVRQKIFDRAIEAANRRMQFNQQRAQQLRGGSFYKPGSAPGAPQAAPAQQQQTQSPAAPAPMLDEARAAIAKGADPEKVKARLREKGIDPGAL